MQWFLKCLSPEFFVFSIAAIVDCMINEENILGELLGF